MRWSEHGQDGGSRPNDRANHVVMAMPMIESVDLHQRMAGCAAQTVGVMKLPITIHFQMKFFHRSLNLALTTTLSLGLLTVLQASEPGTPTAPAFRKVVLETNRTNPLELAVLPDGRVLFIERFGSVKIWKPDTKPTVPAAHLNVHGTLNAIQAKQEDKGSWEAGRLDLDRGLLPRNHRGLLRHPAPSPATVRHLCRSRLRAHLSPDAQESTPSSRRRHEQT